MSKPPFEWSDLRYFLAVARSGKLTEAARRLEVEHSTVSRRLAALEHALGARLFDKEPGGYKLTADGEKLLPSAESMEAIALASQSHLTDSNQTVSGLNTSAVRPAPLTCLPPMKWPISRMVSTLKELS